VIKWIEKNLGNEYIHYFKYDEFKIDEEEIGRGRVRKDFFSFFSSLFFFFSFFRWFFQVTLGDILGFFCISCDGQAFGRVKFPTTGQAFGCVKFSTATHVILERYDGRGIVAKI
ncbi:hypothetical protein RhiirC2_843726, partial [Rhizophagus irregularis]